MRAGRPVAIIRFRTAGLARNDANMGSLPAIPSAATTTAHLESNDFAQEGGQVAPLTSDASSHAVAGTRSRNPYAPGLPIDTPGMFFGRTAELQALVERLTDGRHTAVVGPANIGITSLLRRVARLPQADGFQIAYVDLRSAGLHSDQGLAQSLWSQWWIQIRPGHIPSIAGFAVLESLSRRLAAAGHRLVAILDGYEQLLWRQAQFGPEVLARLEALTREQVVMLITGAHYPLAELHQQAQSASALYELPVQLDLGLLSTRDALGLLSEPLERVGFSLPVAEAAYFADLAGAHPLFLQVAGHYLYEALAGGRYNRERIAGQFKAAAEPYWQEMWASLPPTARATLALEGLPTDNSFADRQVRHLERKGLLIGEGAGAQIFSQGFADWTRAYLRAGQLANEISVSGQSQSLQSGL